MNEIIKQPSLEKDANPMEHNSNYTESMGNNPSEFYNKAQKYWSEVPATINGMLGGLGYINAVDIQTSNQFLRELKIADVSKKHALDCGAGIGRVSKHLLMPLFAKIDLVEQDYNFAKKAQEYCTQDSGCVPGYPSRLGEIHNCGLQEFQPTPNKYGLVWSQWVLGHLTDNDLLNFFQRIRQSLTKDGCFVIKENVTSAQQVDKDDEDSSLTRPLNMYINFLKKSNFHVVKITQQKNFPRGLYPVYMIASRPNKHKKCEYHIIKN